jgi:hypothetical protein
MLMCGVGAAGSDIADWRCWVSDMRKKLTYVGINFANIREVRFAIIPTRL